MQANNVKSTIAFNLERDEGADEYYKQLLVMGASNITITCYKVGMREEDSIPIYYYCKSGANLEEYETFIGKLLEKDEIRRDTMNKTGVARELNIAIWLTMNNVGRLYMDASCRYLSNRLVRIAQKFEGFYEETGRCTRLSFIPYMHVPQMIDHHPNIDKFNDYVRSFNKNALKTHTYDVDTLLLKPPKTGETANVKIKGNAFVSANSCWRLQSATGTHQFNSIQFFISNHTEQYNFYCFSSYLSH